MILAVIGSRNIIDYITALATDTEIEGLNIQAGLASKTTFRNILSGLASVANIPERKNKVLQAATVLFSPEKDFATDPFSNLSELLEESVIPSKNRKNMSNYFEARFLELRKKLFYES